MPPKKNKQNPRLFRDGGKSVQKIAHKEALKVLNGNTELKRTTGTTIGTIFNTMIPFCITSIPQGTGDTTRIGDVVKPVSVRIAMHLDRYVDARFRVILFQAKSDTALNTPDLSELLENVTYPSLSEQNNDNKMDYRILVDKTMMVDANRPNVMFNYKGKLNVGRIQFAGGSTLGWNHLYVAVISDDAFLNGGSFTCRHTVKFQDI